MAIGQGIFKLLVAKKQASGLGTEAGATSAQYMRRVTSNLDLAKDTYESNEILQSQQVRDMRHGLRKVEGTISGELSVGTYQGFIESGLRAVASTAVASTAAVDVTAASLGADTYTGTFTTVGEDWLSDGFKIGQVVQWTGFTDTDLNDHNYIITALTSLVMTVSSLDSTDIAAESAGQSVTCTTVGKEIIVPASSHTRDYWTIEHDFSDITQAEQFTDCAVGSVDVKLPPTGLATIDFPFVGLDMTTSTSPYFTTPTATATGSILAGVNGFVMVAGIKVGLITGFDVSVNGNVTSIGAVVGSNVAPDVQVGKIKVTGNMTILFQDATMRDYFNNETEISVVAAFTTDNTATSDVMTFNMPRVKVGGATKDDGEKGLVMTMPFVALENTAGGAGISTHATTISIQDSQYVTL